MDRRLLLPLFIFFLCSLPALFYPSSAAADVVEKSSSPFSSALETLQKRIGYQFQTVDLLRRAMTHSSYSRENSRGLGILGLNAIEAAAALRFLLADVDAAPAALSRRIADVSALESCAVSGARLGLDHVVRVSAKTNSSSPAVVCGAFRAIFGAVAVDSEKADTAGDVFWGIYREGLAEPM